MRMPYITALHITKTNIPLKTPATAKELSPVATKDPFVPPAGGTSELGGVGAGFIPSEMVSAHTRQWQPFS